MYYICVNILRIFFLFLSVRLKYFSLFSDREFVLYCRIIVFGWYIFIILVIIYSVIYSIYNFYVKLNNFLELYCIGIDFYEDNLCI